MAGQLHVRNIRNERVAPRRTFEEEWGIVQSTAQLVGREDYVCSNSKLETRKNSNLQGLEMKVHVY